MHRMRLAAAVTTSVAVATTGVLAVSAITGNDPPAHAAPAVTSTSVELPSRSVADGTYVAYVRAVGRGYPAVEVEFGSLSAGIVANSRLVDAGLMANVGLFDRVGRPFRITIKHDTIVSAQSVDDTLSAAMSRAGLGARIAISLSTTTGGQ